MPSGAFVAPFSFHFHKVVFQSLELNGVVACRGQAHVWALIFMHRRIKKWWTPRKSMRTICCELSNVPYSKAALSLLGLEPSAWSLWLHVQLSKLSQHTHTQPCKTPSLHLRHGKVRTGHRNVLLILTCEQWKGCRGNFFFFWQYTVWHIGHGAVNQARSFGCRGEEAACCRWAEAHPRLQWQLIIASTNSSYVI